jgi:hypothetical protein
MSDEEKEVAKKRPWYKRIELIAAFVVVVGGAGTILLKCAISAQEATAQLVVERRMPYFNVDHKPLYDSVAAIRVELLKTKMAEARRDSIEAKRDSLAELTNWTINEMASSDVKLRVYNKMVEATRNRVR